LHPVRVQLLQGLLLQPPLQLLLPWLLRQH
jgi:hypothetical protein